MQGGANNKGLVCLIAAAAVVLVFAGSSGIAAAQAAGLKKGFYKKSCPKAEEIAQRVVWNRVAGNPELAAKFLRMFFHDCFVRGCDASVLLDSASNTAEKNAAPNLSLAGFEVIEEVKAAVERECAGVVSCADIVALAARDAVSYQFKASLWQVETGRRDGPVSLASNTGALPSPFAGFSTLLQSFANRGLNLTDLVALSGAHTIGKASCSSVTPRLYQGNTTSLDPLLDSAYAKALMSSCPNPSPSSSTIDLDVATPLKFDSGYYANLQKKQGALASDAALTQNAAAAQMVADLTNPIKFYAAFSMSMKKMGRIDVLTGSKGNIRKQCRSAS